MNLKSDKIYFTRKLSIINMIEQCEERIERELNNVNNVYEKSGLALPNSLKNIARYERIKNYLIERYKN